MHSKIAALLLLSFLLLAPVSCALYRNDRCYVEDEQYQIAYNLFLESGSLDLVERQLEAYEWRRCKVNETLYRLQKEFEVVSNGSAGL